MMLLSGAKGTLAKRAEGGPNVSSGLIDYTFLAASKIRKPAQVFDLYRQSHRHGA